VNNVPGYEDVEDGSLALYAEVTEGLCEYAIDHAVENHANGPYEKLVRFRVMLGCQRHLRRFILFQKPLKAFFFFIGPGPVELFGNFALSNPEEDPTLAQVKNAIEMATYAVPHGGDNGGSLYEGLKDIGEVHWVVRATVGSTEEAASLVDRLARIPNVRLPFVLVEDPTLKV
jgi:hypothetical protein